LNDCLVNRGEPGVLGEFIREQDETWYRIRGYDRMPPFLMSMVSSSDHWMFLSSTGGLTAGRRNSDLALFPYYPDDRVSENSENTGPVTIIRCRLEGGVRLWEPLSARCPGIYDITRVLYKNAFGTAVIFEEQNRDLGLSFRYKWSTSDRFGFVRTSWLKNFSNASINGEILDGVQNILPYGVTTAAQSRLSNLLNAYKRAELDPQTGVATYSLSSTLTDLAEPSESLLATRVFQSGVKDPVILLSAAQMTQFREGSPVRGEHDVRGVRGAYLLSTSFSLEGGAERSWKVVADVEQDARNIVWAINWVRKDAAGLSAAVEADIKECDDMLLRIVAGADGLQSNGDQLASAHHFSNVLFNTMRGGTFPSGYTVERADLLDAVSVRNRTVARNAAEFFASLPETIERAVLLQRAARTGSRDVERLCSEYLPLAFSRRHGDPSRPWNVFSINIRNPDGSRRYDYQGNWRDIFQNWEALAWSYPQYLDGMIFRFVNATTADGYNPYRLTRDGFEWEVPDPDNPWANIGYWGDHQIIYLVKLLEALEKFSPGTLSTLFSKKLFTYANVPYRIRTYREILENWYDTIIFDEELHKRIERAVEERGTDARLLSTEAGDVIHVTFAEKLLVLLLTKLGNLVPEGGIWMNTQRPEWNDANNALTGKGLSVVTTGYLRRYIVFLKTVLTTVEHASFSVGTEVEAFFAAILATFTEHASAPGVSFSDEKRRTVMDQLGEAASTYRWKIYRYGLSGESVDLSAKELQRFLDLALRLVDHTLRINERPDHLYHSYNTLILGDGRAEVRPLYGMLEGQVAILSSGLLTATGSSELLFALRGSRLYRADQQSYLLYPDRSLPGFVEKNTIGREQAEQLKLVNRLIHDGDESLLVRDENGAYHFNGLFRNSKDVSAALSSVKSRYPDLVDDEGEKVLALFESLFRHDSFTGRSGSFFAYEGLGSIYWHMISKLLLAVQETIVRAVEGREEWETIRSLRERYYDIRMGLGFNKSPEVYGAFPTDPYSHTPAGKGAKQPGMTGQVKEEILTRPLELGLSVVDGRIEFASYLLRPAEFTTPPGGFAYIAIDGSESTIDIPSGAFVFTFCQVPIVVKRSDRACITATLSSGEQVVVDGYTLDRELSVHLFARSG